MRVTLKLTPVLRQYAENRETIDVEGTTVRECLEAFVDRYPETRQMVFSNPEAPLICMFLNSNVVFPDKLETPVADGDVLDLSPVIGGG